MGWADDTDPAFEEWLPLSEAPRDGTWITLRADPDRGGKVAIGRWAPKHYPSLATYEWEVIETDYDGFDFNHWSDGYAYDWLPFPPPKDRAKSAAKEKAEP